MPEPLPIMVGYVLWFVFVIAWHVTDRRIGRLWSASVKRMEGHRVVDTGPYRLVRHPMYTGFIVIDVALAILCGSALALVGLAAITLGLWMKARLEEQFLSEELGAAAYAGYTRPKRQCFCLA